MDFRVRLDANHNDSLAIARICNDAWQLGAPAKRRAFVFDQLRSRPLASTASKLAPAGPVYAKLYAAYQAAKAR
jgi:hypothetical protein